MTTKIVAILVALLCTFGLAHAATITPDSACGAMATGKRPADDALFTGTIPNQRVGPDGYWRACEAPAVAPGGCDAAPRVAWATGPHKCISDTERRPLRNGQSALLFQTATPGTVGYLHEVCRDGVRTTANSLCHNRCVTDTTIVRGACKYRYKPRGEADALAAGESMPVGSGRCEARIACVGGGDVELVSR